MARKVKGFATNEGTIRYAKRAQEQRKIPSFHFRKFLDITFTSLGVGTYLGSLEPEVDVAIENAIRESLLSGAINIVDSAINYRFQRSERCIARALSSLVKQSLVDREEVFLSTKNGYLAPDADHKRGQEKYISDELLAKGVIAREDIVGNSHCMTVPFLKHELDRSLENLGIETLDLLYLHNSAESQIHVVGKEEYYERLRSAFGFYESVRKLGKIRYYGLATWNSLLTGRDELDHVDLEDVLAIAEDQGGKDHGFRFVQFPLNLSMQEALNERNQVMNGKLSTLLDVCAHYGIGAFTSVPLMQGRLARDGESSGALKSLQFVRSCNGVIAPLVGHKDPRHVKENVRVAYLEPRHTQ